MSIAAQKPIFKTQLLSTATELRQLKPEWAELYRRCPYATSFQRPEWLLSWVDAFMPQQIRAIAIRNEDTLVGLAPLLIYEKLNEPTLAFLGGGVSDYLDILAEPQFTHGVVEAVCLAATDIPEWNTFELTDLSSCSPLLASPLLRQHACEHDVCSALDLPEDREQLLHIFSKRQRANLRNAHSRLYRAGGARIEIADSEALNEALLDLVRLHTTRWTLAHQSGVLSDAAVKHFHCLSAPELLKSGVLRLYRLRQKGRTLAVIHALFDGETVYCYLQGFDPEAAYFSPGTVLMFKLMEDAVAEGFRKFDFLRGQETYKQHWRARPVPTYRVTLPRSVFGLQDPLAEAA
jgi:CelD/BcsL family acetyltransferase involved in cellulose biosynthesis